jgi:carboxyl-terminal processing protease
MPHAIRQDSSRRLAFAMVAVTAIGGPILASPAQNSSADESSVATWSEAIWEAAIADRTDEVERLLDLVPDRGGVAATRLRERVESRDRHADASDEDRGKERAEALEELDRELAAGDLSKALTAAVRIQTLSDDWAEVLDSDRIAELVRQSEIAEREAEATGDFLLAQEILFRLRTLHEDVGRGDDYRRHNASLERVNRRIGLLAQYAPRALHDLRARQAARLAPEEEFPEFNPAFAEDWREQVRGISHQMLTQAMRTVAFAHIGNVGWRPLLDGGLDSLEIFATTAALGETFPALTDPAKVAAWGEAIGGLRERLAKIDEEDLTRHHANRIVGELMQANRRVLDLPESVLFREFGDGAMEQVGKRFEDQYTEIIWPERYRRFQQQVEGSFVGVGILIRHDDKREIMVVNPLEGSPAWRGGVQADDRIVEVDGVSTVGWSTNRAVDEITGPAGEIVTLGLRREGEAELVAVDLVREAIKMRSVNGWRKESLDESGEPQWDWWLDEPAGIGYVRLTSFNEDSFRDFLDAIRQMRSEGVLRGLVLDLRYNPGGLLKSAVDFTNLYVSDGKIVTCEDRFGREVMRIDAQRNRSMLEGLPTVVLVNQGSASASEIVAGALQAHGAAVVMGDRSFGKGSVQEVHDLSDRQAAAVLKLTTQLYRLPPSDEGLEGRLVHKQPGADDWGVNPDIVVKMTPSQIEQTLELRAAADRIFESEDGPERPDPRRLVDEGIDPQLEMALLLLNARALADLAGDESIASSGG